MDHQTVFTKTAKGMMEATGKTSGLSRDMRALLKEIDGKATLSEVHARLGKMSEAKLQDALQVLTRKDYIREFKPSRAATPSRAAAPPPSPKEAKIDLDFTTAMPTIPTLTRKAEEEARKKAEAEARKKAEAEAAAKAKIEAETKAIAAAAAQARAEAEARARKEGEERARREAEEQARKEAEERTRREAEERARAEAQARAETEARAREEAEQAERERKEAEERARREAEEQARKEIEERAKREAEERARAEEQARIEAEARAREEAERAKRERKEAEERARREAEEKARREAEERAKREAEEKARKEAEERARREAEEKARKEAEERAQREAEEKARKEAEERARREAEEKARKEAEERARREAEEQARKEAEERERREAEEKARKEAEERARREAEERARAEEQARIEAEEQARKEAEERAKREAEEQARKEAEEQAKREAEEQARREAEERARAEEQARAEAEARAREEAERAERERQEAEEQARRKAEELARAEEQARIEAEAREREEAERKAQELAERERQAAQEEIARKSAQQPPTPAESSSSLDDMIKIDTDFDAALSKSAGAALDAAMASTGADDALQKEAEERARRATATREDEARARKQADAATKRDEEGREKVDAPDETGALWSHAEEQAYLQAQDAETERHFAEMEKELEAEPLSARDEEKAFESRELEREQREQREQREREQREREEDDARERARVEAAAHAREAKAAPKVVRAKIRKQVNWGKPAALSLFLVLLIGLFAVPFVPFDGYIPQFEKLIGAHLQQPVKIGSLHLMLLPRPHWRLDDVSIGNEAQLTVPRINAIAGLGSMFSAKKAFTSVELESPVLSERGLVALLFGTPLGQDLKVASIVAINGKLDSDTFKLPALNAKIAIGENGTWRRITFETPDHATSVQFTKDTDGAHIEAQTDAFTMPLNPSFVLGNFYAKGTIRRGELRLSEFKGEIYGGYLSGSASLKWGSDWSLSGEFTARAMDPGKLASQLIGSGRLEGNGRYALQGKSYAALFASPHLQGNFSVERGTLLGVSLGRFLQSGEVGGRTEFAALTGKFAWDGGKTQLRQIHLAAGPISANGNADTDAAKHISGRFAVDLKSDVAHAHANLTLSGALGAPQFGH